MQDMLVQAVRHKLEKRVRRLTSANLKSFRATLTVFLRFLESLPLLAGVKEELLVRVRSQNVQRIVDTIVNEGPLFGDSEDEVAAIGYYVLERIVTDTSVDPIDLGLRFGAEGTAESCLDVVRALFLEPFCEWLDEHLDEQQAILFSLRRYKHRCEWFHAQRLRSLLRDDTRQGEKALAFDLYEFLHNQGIDFHIEPSSASGIADLVADQIGEDRVVADVKIFWPEKSKGTSYLISGFHQVYTYARDYNESCAYLVVFKLCEEDLSFAIPSSKSRFPCFSLNNKTIFIIVIDICEHSVPASKRGPLKRFDIAEEQFIRSIECQKVGDDADGSQTSQGTE